ncbi:MAG TPA: hypothetical protein VJ831_10380 [Jatrophihabitantaceae bacterium]|nr:hypothetical protein [Jatrophihabitantaceae bacterium]
MRAVLVASTLAVMLAAACSSSKSEPKSTGLGASRTVNPVAADPANYVSEVTNQWFPLHRGQTWTYRGEKDGKPAQESVVVTSMTKTILGVACTEVSDKLYLDGKLEETTKDWYAQDKQGNVWYFGEDTAELNPDGSVKTREGTWTAGVDGAKAGIYITAQPQFGVDYLQEYYKGQAEDHFVAKRTGVSVTVPGGTFSTLETQEYTPLEPDVIDHKYYAPGVGVVKEASSSGDERTELVSYTR